MRPQKYATKVTAVYIAKVAVKPQIHAACKTAATTAAHTVSPCRARERRQTPKSTAVRLAPYHHRARAISSVIHLYQQYEYTDQKQVNNTCSTTVDAFTGLQIRAASTSGVEFQGVLQKREVRNKPPRERLTTIIPRIGNC